MAAGKKITTYERVAKLATLKKCVWNKQHGRHQPAAMVVHFPAIMLHRLLKSGQLFEHKK